MTEPKSEHPFEPIQTSSGHQDVTLAERIAKKVTEIGDAFGVDPWVTRSPGEAANYIAGYAKGIQEAAEIAAQTDPNAHGIAARIRELEPAMTAPETAWVSVNETRTRPGLILRPGMTEPLSQGQFET